MKFGRNTLVLCGVVGLTMSCGVTKTKDRGGKFSQNDSALADRWQSECAAADVLDLSRTIKDYRYNAIGDFDHRESFYTDEGCNDEVVSYQLTGTYQALGQDDKNSSLKRINYTVKRVVMTPKTEAGVDLLNKGNVCDVSDWKLNEEREVTGQSCLGSTIKKGDVVFDVYQVVNKDTLFLGHPSTFGAALKLTERPNDVDRELPLHERD